MFTGLIQRLGRLTALTRQGGGWSLAISHEAWSERLVVGESVAVQGACLTVTTVRSDGFAADVLDETLVRTALGRLQPGAAVNLERALRLADRLGGHLVSGHVDECGRLAAIRPRGRDRVLRVSCSAGLCRQTVMKGSIAIDGVSLTVSGLGDDWIEANVIPHTWDATSLSARQPGEQVNLEGDLIGKYVARLLGPAARGGLSGDVLAAAGFT
jgi:riboflavin synthase